MKITHDDIMKFVSHGSPAGKFNPEVIVYSEDELKANIYNAMVYIQNRHLSSKSSGRKKPTPPRYDETYHRGVKWLNDL